ncbi:MAG: helix-turn-helix domain-containing protein [Bombilactobacillus mellifer]|uniref:helix-turn-helix domain-containing protein n=1 Tax=Bombilactobacillus mellifer TaxID=1218492 RepID=UPI0023EF75BB|nr:helix-turn-helix transcriptional regulator [Bombilactobacillus mellifer]MCT6825808.1 helix-turn-helix domain-containing protein [Bombilactobacillus mellifer]MCT6894950.1 helix-turn-helix domain-containing protein [Bombilactobacillus mellifer]
MPTFERVKQLAEKKKISIVELEEKLGFSRNSLYSWKRNKPSVEKLQKVADYFHVSTDYLLGRESQGRQNIDITPAITNPAITLSFKGRIIPPEEVEMIRRIIEGGRPQ